ncbi:MAG: YncE family protein [Acidimicrobiales bacterium]
MAHPLGKILTRGPTHRSRTCAVAIATLIVAVALAGCGGAVTSAPAVKPVAIYPAPAGMLAGGAPQPSGAMWVLAGPASSRAAYEMNLLNGQLVNHFPVSSNAQTVAQLPDGPVLIGISTATSGAIQVFNSQTLQMTATWPLPGPILQLRAGQGGAYALVQVGRTESIEQFSATGTLLRTLPVPSDTVAITADPVNAKAYVLEANGVVSTVNAAGQTTTVYKVSASGRDIVSDPTTKQLFILKGITALSNISVVSIQTQSTIGVLPAPANCVGIQISSDGSQLYALVGSPNIGNVQVFTLPRVTGLG